MSTDIIARSLAQKAQTFSRTAPYGPGTLGRKLQEQISLKDFGAVGDGVTDDTAAVQAFVTYICTNAKRGLVPEGTYKLTSTILFPNSPCWSIVGAGWFNTTFHMATDNVKIFHIGGAAGIGATHSMRIEDVRFTYANAQTGQTGAAPLHFSTMVYESTLRRIRFDGGYYGHTVASGVGGPWGCVYDELVFASGLRGGAMDWSGVVNGVPNNKWGRILVEANNMADILFKQVRGYNWVIDTIEILSVTNLQLFSFQSGSQVTIGAIKLEQCAFSGTLSLAGGALINAPGGFIHMSQIYFGGSSSSIAPANSLAIFNVSAPGNLTVENTGFGLSGAASNFYINGGNGFATFNNINYATYLVPLTNIASSAAADTTVYLRDANPRLPGNGGDMANADYSVTSNGGANIIMATTALTAPRTVEIMPDTHFLFHGRKVKVLSRGAVNGANTIVIKAAGITKATISADNYAVELTWRRHGVPHAGWVITFQGAA